MAQSSSLLVWSSMYTLTISTKTDHPTLTPSWGDSIFRYICSIRWTVSSVPNWSKSGRSYFCSKSCIISSGMWIGRSFKQWAPNFWGLFVNKYSFPSKNYLLSIVPIPPTNASLSMNIVCRHIPYPCRTLSSDQHQQAWFSSTLEGGWCLHLLSPKKANSDGSRCHSLTGWHFGGNPESKSRAPRSTKFRRNVRIADAKSSYWTGPVKLPLCLCVKMVQKRPQMCYFFGPKCAIVDRDVTFLWRHVMWLCQKKILRLQ